MNIARTVVLILAIVGSWTGVHAQELVVNGTFDNSVDDWDLQNMTFGSIDHDPLDAGGSPASGSALITNSFIDADMNLPTVQCIYPLPADRDYVYGGTMRVADGTVTEGHSSIQIWFWDDPNCSAGHGGSTVTSPVFTNNIGWTSVRQSATALQNSVAARLTLWNVKVDSGGDLSFHYDNVFLRTASIFADDFESGDTTAWD